jgi:hypothetical protein
VTNTPDHPADDRAGGQLVIHDQHARGAIEGSDPVVVVGIGFLRREASDPPYEEDQGATRPVAARYQLF